MVRYLIAIGATAGVLALSACGSEKCIVLANGGNKLCGDEAAAWCDSTDAIRNSTGNTGDPMTDQTVRDSQAACDEIRDQ